MEWAAKANYVNPETRGDEIPLMEMILLAICYVVVALRLYTRTFVTKSFGWDDALIIFNMVRVVLHVLHPTFADAKS